MQGEAAQVEVMEDAGSGVLKEHRSLRSACRNRGDQIPGGWIRYQGMSEAVYHPNRQHAWGLSCAFTAARSFSFSLLMPPRLLIRFFSVCSGSWCFNLAS